MQSTHISMPPPPPRHGAIGQPVRQWTVYAGLMHMDMLTKRGLANDDIATQYIDQVFLPRFRSYDRDFHNADNMNIGIWPIQGVDQPIKFSILNVHSKREYHVWCHKHSDQLQFDRVTTIARLPTLRDK